MKQEQITQLQNHAAILVATIQQAVAYDKALVAAKKLILKEKIQGGRFGDVDFEVFYRSAPITSYDDQSTLTDAELGKALRGMPANIQQGVMAKAIAARAAKFAQLKRAKDPVPVITPWFLQPDGSFARRPTIK